MSKKQFIGKFLIVAILAIVTTGQVFALKSDRDQPANIEADDIEFDFKKGTRTYINNVLAVQGTLRLKADKLHAVYVDGELDNATAWGSLARFKQRPDGKPDDVEGSARKIIVNQKQNTLTLIGSASLKQGGDTARGDTIEYNMANDTLRVRGGAKVGARGKDPAAGQPKRTIEDPFKDDIDTSSAANQETDTAKKENNINDEKNQNEELSKDIQEDETEKSDSKTPETVPVGRSRLIIQPKK